MHSHTANAIDFQVSSPDSFLIKLLMILGQNSKDANLNVVPLQYGPYPLSPHCPCSHWLISSFLMVLIHVSIGAIELHIYIPALHLSSKPIPLPAQDLQIPHWPLKLRTDLNHFPPKMPNSLFSWNSLPTRNYSLRLSFSHSHLYSNTLWLLLHLLPY